MFARSVVSATVVLFASIVITLIGAQSPLSPSPRSIGPRTPWGHSDLQGIWTTETLTPLERPAGLANKAVLTAEEAAELERRTDASRADGPPREGDPGTYNRFWSEAGTRVVSGRRTSLIIDPPNGRIPWKAGKREESERVEASYGQGTFASHEDFDTGERCITDGPTLVPLQGYNMNFEIVQSPDHVVLLHEMFHQRTVIPLDRRPHLGKGLGQWLGDARGHWEANTLVVETTNFADLSNYRWARLWRSSRPTLRLVERFTRLDENTIDYRFTVEDPTLFAHAWTAAIPMTRIPGPVYEYGCHEGNYSIRNMLSGARARDTVIK
jgi:hypothetical protein